MDTNLQMTGVILIILAVIHVIFPSYFKWKEELAAISLVNRQLMYVHTFFIALVVLMIGLLCLFCTPDLLHTRLGGQLCAGLSVFWGIRLFFQFAVYSPELWKGKKFETLIHVLFSLLWIYLTVVFYAAYSVSSTV